ncbi:hypothetical protein DICPUDRAFT_152901 [Dictyostelium purpureum]|uniref:Importin N-terminal domain-containing protein n=1 Tax=Dictyostelium purpureum TaxID=5786 RepID=F0ZMJ9_DICPU|nr:uncharacterized protein DICPUDRAFT_152901 [Dictyostelium purpureum]EGC34840.1 hypothetical protein DICPUDRAFT_152901 [Dictyostelium purpureum]|eukprot:XP_003288647.1 hypothetical protein DICPUDRAFT_152901 [Dictyostelium purpureum]
MDDYENCPSYSSLDNTAFGFLNGTNLNNTSPTINTQGNFCPVPPGHLNGNGVTNNDEKLEPPPTLEVISQALYALYKSTDTNERKLAEKWLILFQKQPSAWEFCPRLLFETSIFELQYFGASTLESKLKKEWNESSVEMKSNILNTIVGIIQNPTKLPVCCVTRISVSLTIAVMYTFPDIWKNAIFDIIHLSLQQQDLNSISLQDPSQNRFNKERLLLVLEFLSILPDELKKKDLNLCNFSEIQKELKRIIDLVYKYLLSILLLPLEENLDFIKISFKALSGWLKYLLPSASMLQNCFEITFNIGQKKVSKNNITSYPLIDSLALVLEGSSLSIESQFNSNNSSNNDSEINCYIHSFKYAIENSLNIFPNFYREAIQNEDDIKSKSIFNVFIQFLSSNNTLLFTNDLIHRCLNLLISFVEIGNRETISLLFYLIDDFKTHTMLVQQDQNVLKFFFLKLLNRFIDISAYPKEDGSVNCDNSPLSSSNGVFCKINDVLLDDDIEQFRNSASDCLLSIQDNSIVPKETFLQFLIDKLNQAINECNQNWEYYESILYYIYSFSGGSQECQIDYVPILLTIIPSIPIKSIPLIRTSIKLVGRYSTFLKNNTDYLNKVIFDLLPALTHNELISSASSSLLSICISSKCALKLWPHFNQILEQIEMFILGNQKSNPNVVQIYKSLLHILQVAPAKEIPQAFSRLINPIVNSINEIQQQPQPQQHRNQLAIYLNILSSVTEIIEYDEFQMEQPNAHCLYSFFRTVIPIQGKLLKQFGSDFEIIDSITMFYRFMMLHSREIAIDFTDEILQQATQSFNQYPIASLLQIISAIIIPKLPVITIQNIKNSISQISNIFLNTLKSFKENNQLSLSSTSSSSLLTSQNQDFSLDFTITPDITKDYLILLTKVLKTLPQCIEPNIISTICIYIVYNIPDLTKDKSTAQNCCLFLSTCLSLVKLDNQIIKETILPNMNQVFEGNLNHGCFLVYNILMNICWSPFSVLTLHFSDVLLAFGIGYPKQLKQNATAILNDPSFFKDKNINTIDKQLFLTNIQKSNSPQAEFRSYVRTFSFICNDK